MIQRFIHKLLGMVSTNHSDCGAMQLTNHFLKAHSIGGDATTSSLVAVIPCSREIARRLKAQWSMIRAN
ncbi:MAG: hypothetical protein ACKVOE_04105 [Rickettsiales bacterium]